MERTSRATLSHASLSVSNGGRLSAEACFSVPPYDVRAVSYRSAGVDNGDGAPPVSCTAYRSCWKRSSGKAAIAGGVAGGGDVAAPAESSLPAVAA